MKTDNVIEISTDSIYEVMNPVYYPYLDDFRRYQIFKGGASAGKSVFLSQRDIYHMLTIPGYNILIVRKVGRDNHDTTFAELKKVIYAGENLDRLFRINESRGAEEITCLNNGNKAVFRGLDNVNQLKSLTFETGDLIEIRIEEADEATEDDFKQLNLRLRGRGVVPKHIVLSFNPIDIGCWIKQRFFDRKLEARDGFICETTYKDNYFLSDDDKRILESYKLMDEYYYQVYVLNQWGARTTARVFHNIEIHDFDIDENSYQNVRAGADYGFNHANAYERSGMLDGELYIYGEVYAKQIMNNEFISRIKDAGHILTRPIICDSANPDKVAEFNDAGLIAYGAKKGPGSLERGINYLKSLPKIHIHATNCPNAAREFPRFKYRELKDGSITEQYVEIDDDTIAAIRYGNEDLLPAEAPGGGHHILRKKRRHGR